MKGSGSNLNIAIFGASSQVGSSLAFYLKNFTQHQVTCFIRSSYSSVFFDICGIKTITTDLKNTEELKNILKDQDLVLDFTYPTGQIYEISRSIKENIERIIKAMPATAVYVYMSSIHALCIPPENKMVRRYILPWTSYGYIKKQAEKQVVALGKIYQVKTYNFRLGQIHGFLQSVNESFREKLAAVPVAYLDSKAGDPLNILFISSLGDAIVKCGYGELSHNLYTLIAYPQWQVSELYDYYKKFFSLDTNIVYSPRTPARTNSIRSLVVNKVKRYRPLIESYVLLKFPDLSLKLKGKYRVGEVSKINAPKQIEYLDINYIGLPPTEIIMDLDCSFESVYIKEKLMQETYLKLLREKSR